MWLRSKLIKPSKINLTQAIVSLASILFGTSDLLAQNPANLIVNQRVWSELKKSQQEKLIEKYPAIELVPSDAVGLIDSVRIFNRSSTGSVAGSNLGAVLGQSFYVDRALEGRTNYSAVAQVGAALLGSALGSTLDSEAVSRYLFQYSIKTADGGIREVAVASSDDRPRPVGMCVHVAGVVAAEATLCATDANSFMSMLDEITLAPAGALIIQKPRGTKVNCRIPEVGLTTIDSALCSQIQGKVER